jgi:hypothetical protein
MVLYGGATYLWNRKYIPMQLAKGKLKKPLGTIFKEVHQYTFKEDTGNLLKKADPKIQKFFSYKAIHIVFIVGGVIAYILTGNMLLMLSLPLSFIIGFSRAMPVIKRRTEVLDRIFLIASSSIKFTSGPRAKNAAPPASWNHIQVEQWQGKDNPVKMVITFPSGNGPEVNSQKTFEKSFEANVTDENIWNFEWDLPHDRMTIEAAPLLPTKLLYPGSGDAAWSVFPVGESSAGVASYDVATFPHVLVAGPSGTGKSVLQRNIVFHTIQHNDRWRFLGVDLKRVELTPYNKYKKTIMGIATDVEQGVAVLKYAYNEMMDRYKEMERIGVNNVMDMEDPPYCILLMIDEATMFLGASGSKTEEGKAEDAMKGEASDLVGKILRLGRASGVHMLIAMQRPDATVLRGEFKANMDVRMAAGRMDSTPSSMVLDSGEAVNLPGIRGRGLIRVGGSLTTFQGYFAPQDWIDDYILKNPNAEPSTVAPGGHLHDKYLAMKRLEAKAAAEAANPTEASETPAVEAATSSDDTAASPSMKDKLSLKALRRGKKNAEEPAATAAVVEEDLEAIPEEVEDTEVTSELLPVEETINYEDDPLTENRQNLLDSLGRKEEDTLEGTGTNEIPDFFTSTARKDSPASARTIEPELELDDEDFILDDFDEEEEVVVVSADSVDSMPVPPADIMTQPTKPAPSKVKHEWVTASPFGGNEESEEQELLFEEELDEEPEPAPVKKPSMPVRPVKPVIQEPVMEEPAVSKPAMEKPQRPVSPFAPKTSSPMSSTVSGNPFLPKK